MSGLNLQDYQESADAILSRAKEKPVLGMVLGTALGPLADEITDRIEIPYAEIPHMLRSTAPGHAGMLILGRLAQLPVIALSGRFHYYEGYSFEELAMPVRLLRLLGVKGLLLTNAAGCVNTSWNPGDVMLIQDHINLMGASPMRGANLEAFGPRFFDCSDIYAPRLRELAMSCAKELGQENSTREGIYFYMPGPGYETPAEIRAIRTLGGDAVGMSTVTEALTAAHCGLPVLGISLLTNWAAGISDQKLSDEEVLLGAAKTAHRLQALVRLIVEKISENPSCYFNTSSI